MASIRSLAHRLVQARWKRLEAHVKAKAGQDLTGLEWGLFVLGLAGQKLVDDAEQIRTLCVRAIRAFAKVVTVLSAILLLAAWLINALLGAL